MFKKHKGEIALLTAALLYGLFGIFSKIISFNIPIFYQAWVRNVFATIAIGVLFFTVKKWRKPIARGDIKWFFLRGICGFTSFVTIFIAFAKTDISTTYFLSYAAAAIVGYITGNLIFHEKLDKINIASLALAVIGLLLVYAVNFNSANGLYLILALASGIILPGWNVFSKKISGIYSNVQLNFIDSIFATALPFTASVFLKEPWVPIQFNITWIATFLFGLMFIATGFLIVYGFSKVDAQLGSLILLFEIVVGIAFAFLFFGETVSVQSLVGGILITAAIILRSRKLDSFFKTK